MQQRRPSDFIERLPVTYLGADWQKGLLYDKVNFATARGPVMARYYPVGGGSSAVIMVGGVGGGFDSPAHELYGKLCESLKRAGVAGMRVRFRDPQELEEAVHDVRAAIRFLMDEQQIKSIGLIGHSFGGAVVITAAAVEPVVDAVVTLSSQSYETEDIVDVDAPVLLIHGTEDNVLPAECSRDIFRRAQEPKELLLVKGDHVLSQFAHDVFDRVYDWCLGNLRPKH